MFYSYKNFPISIQSFNKYGIAPALYNQYNFTAQNISLEINPNAGFAYIVNQKHPFRGNNADGLAAVINVSFLSQAPKDYIFINNILKTGGDKDNFKITCGNAIFNSGYLRSYNISADPDNMISSQAEFVFYSVTNSQFNGTLGVDSYDVGVNQQNFYSHGSSTTLIFQDNSNEFSSHDIRKIDLSYKADVQPIYTLEKTYPHRVVYNEEQIDLFVELNTYDMNIRNINSLINNTNINYASPWSGDAKISMNLKSGYLVGKNFSLRTNDIINSRISLKYHI